MEYYASYIRGLREDHDLTQREIAEMLVIPYREKIVIVIRCNRKQLLPAPQHLVI